MLVATDSGDANDSGVIESSANDSTVVNAGLFVER